MYFIFNGGGRKVRLGDVFSFQWGGEEGEVSRCIFHLMREGGR